MFIIRWLLGRIILTFNFIFSPSSPKLTDEQVQSLAEKTAHLSLYQLPSCPFCVKVRRAMKRQGIQLALRNINQNNYREELINHGGKKTVPCLRIDHDSNTTEWLYESSDIIKYLSNIKA